MSREQPGPRDRIMDAFSRTRHFSEGAYAHHVEMVPVETLDRMRDPGLPESHYETHEAEYTGMLQDHMAEHGARSPVIIGYDPKHKATTINDGHHRIYAAKKLGMTHLPARVERMNSDPVWAKRGHPVPGHDFEGHVPAELRPSDIGLRP